MFIQYLWDYDGIETEILRFFPFRSNAVARDNLIYINSFNLFFLLLNKTFQVHLITTIINVQLNGPKWPACCLGDFSVHRHDNM